MKMFGKVLALILCVLSMAACAGCTAEPDDGGSVSVSPQEKKSLIGFSMATYKEDRWLQDREILVAKAKQAGYDIVVSNANNDPELQLKQVGEIIENGIDVLVIVPDDYLSAAGCVSLAKKNGIPVISYDRIVGNSDVDVYVSFDNYHIGELLAEYMLEAVPDGKYLLIKGSENDANSKMIYDGAMSVLQPLIDEGKIEILGEIWANNWLREAAYLFTVQQIGIYGDEINGVIACNDSLAWGAIDALSEAQLTGKVKVVGQDADLSACQRIVDGTQLMTIYKPIPSLADKTIELCAAFINGEKIEYNKTINNGKKDVPAIYLDVIPATAENMKETVIKDGFHLEDEVYRN